MAIVNALRFDKSSVGIIADEEYWFLGRRKSYFQDTLQHLTDEEIIEKTGIIAVYGGTGTPSFHWDIIKKSRAKIKEEFSSRAKNIKTIYDISKIVLDVLQEVKRERINQKLKFMYGFTIDDVNRGYFEFEGKKYDIKQKKIKDKSLGLVMGSEKSFLTNPILQNKAVICGYDQKDGVSMYYLNSENSVMSFTSGGYEAIGPGKYASGLAFAEFFQGMPLYKRREGFSRIEGMIQLINSAIMAADYYNEVGGLFNIIFIDGEKKNPGDRIIEVFDNKGKLASEIVRSFKLGMITKEDTGRLIDELIFKGANIDLLEEQLYKSSKDADKLELLLRGYKEMELCDQEPVKQAKEKSRKGKGE